ncbi:MAG: hypothetical protein VX335_01905 [Pseudomonadota bacterium]|nr:hypothetical protein [Pseudomonadota bacterium]
MEKYSFNDPTKPYAFKEKTKNIQISTSTLVLAMTFISSKGSAAVINGVSYKVGDEIDGHILKKIEPNKVTLISLSSGEKITLTAKRNLVLEKKTVQNNDE